MLYSSYNKILFCVLICLILTTFSFVSLLVPEVESFESTTLLSSKHKLIAPPSIKTQINTLKIKKQNPFDAFDFTSKPLHKISDKIAQKYTYDELTLTAIISNINNPIALLETPNKQSVKVQLGSLLGNTGGVVSEITDHNIIVKEELLEYDGSKTLRLIEIPLKRS